MGLGGPRSRHNPHLKFVEVPGIERATSSSVVGHADHYNNEVSVCYGFKSLIEEEETNEVSFRW